MAWVLTCVFVRFLEDNRLVDPPKLSGPGERLRRARDEHELYFREHPSAHRPRVPAGRVRRPGQAARRPRHLRRAQPDPRSSPAGSAATPPDAADVLPADRAGDRAISSTTSPTRDWDTRFLGDLYQDLSEAARKKYALLQTPEFVEEFILDRTLDPAIDEFGARTEASA